MLHLFRIKLLFVDALSPRVLYSPHTSETSNPLLMYLSIQKEWAAIAAYKLLSEKHYRVILDYFRKQQELL